MSGVTGAVGTAVIDGFLLEEAPRHSAQWLARELRRRGNEIGVAEVRQHCRKLHVELGTSRHLPKPGPSDGPTDTTAGRSAANHRGEVPGLKHMGEGRTRKAVANSLGERFPSIRAAAMSRGRHAQTMSDWCKSGKPDADGVIWRFVEEGDS